jgi:hypothetical protein
MACLRGLRTWTLFPIGMPRGELRRRQIHRSRTMGCLLPARPIPGISRTEGVDVNTCQWPSLSRVIESDSDVGIMRYRVDPMIHWHCEIVVECRLNKRPRSLAGYAKLPGSTQLVILSMADPDEPPIKLSSPRSAYRRVYSLYSGRRLCRLLADSRTSKMHSPHQLKS